MTASLDSFIDLKADRLVLREDTTGLLSQLKSGELEAVCPCQAVAWHLLPQAQAFSLLVEAHDRRLLTCISSSDLHRAHAGEVDTLRAVDPHQASGELTFVRPDLVQDLPRLLDTAAVQEFFGVADVVREFFDGYAVGPPLRTQEGSLEFRRDLTRAFNFLGFVDLLDEKLLQSPFAHSSAIMLMFRALGLHQVQAVAPFVADPGRFIAAAIGNVFAFESEDERSDFTRDLDDALWLAFGWYRSESPTSAATRFRYPSELAREMLRNIQSLSTDIARHSYKLSREFDRPGATERQRPGGLTFSGRKLDGLRELEVGTDGEVEAESIAAMQLLFHSYEPGRTLRSQDGSEEVRRILRRGVAFLLAVDLMPPGLLRLHHGHLEALRLIRRTTGLRAGTSLANYVANPARFFACLLVNAFDVAPHDRTRLLGSAESLLWKAARLPASSSDLGSTEMELTFTPAQARSLLHRIQEQHTTIARAFRQLRAIEGVRLGAELSILPDPPGQLHSEALFQKLVLRLADLVEPHLTPLYVGEKSKQDAQRTLVERFLEFVGRALPGMDLRPTDPTDEEIAREVQYVRQVIDSGDVVADDESHLRAVEVAELLLLDCTSRLSAASAQSDEVEIDPALLPVASTSTNGRGSLEEQLGLSGNKLNEILSEFAANQLRQSEVLVLPNNVLVQTLSDKLVARPWKVIHWTQST